MKKETYYTQELLKRLKKIPNSWWAKIQQVGIVGTPDVIGCVKCPDCQDGKFVAFEAKVEGGRTTKIQEEMLKQLRDAGAIAQVVRLPDSAYELLQFVRRLRDERAWRLDVQALP